jgi:RecA-family ATPase
VAIGGFTLGDIHCPQGDALYCSLEDHKRRLQKRMRKLFGREPRSTRLTFITKMPRLTEGGLELLRKWIEGAPNPRLVTIDTLAMVRTPNRKEQAAYDADYAAVIGLRELAHEFGIAIVIVHHLRKMEADDPFDTVSGTLGLTGCPDAIAIIKRDTAGTLLLARGRDIDEVEKAITFNRQACTWAIEGDADAIRRSRQQQAILAALREADGPQSPQQLAAATGMKQVNIKFLLGKMVQGGVLRRVGYGRYEVAPKPEEEADAAA